jgi:pimeloyl-ACP methyl ester carboxylesterase
MFVYKKNTDMSVFFIFVVMKENYINIEGCQICYAEQGEGPVTILFIHGNSMSKSNFSGQFKSTALHGYRLLAIDLPGHGNSSMVNYQSHFVQSLLNIIHGFIEQKELKKIVLCGHSLGGHIALQILPAQKNKIVGCCITATPPLKPDAISKVTPFNTEPIANVLFETSIGEPLAEQWLKYAFYKEVTSNSFAQDILNTDENFRAGVGKALNSGEIKDEVEIIGHFLQPVLMVQGKHDKILNHRYIDFIEDKSENLLRKTIFNSSGHFPHIEETELFNEVLESYIQEVN